MRYNKIIVSIGMIYQLKETVIVAVTLFSGKKNCATRMILAKKFIQFLHENSSFLQIPKTLKDSLAQSTTYIWFYQI